MLPGNLGAAGLSGVTKNLSSRPNGAMDGCTERGETTLAASGCFFCRKTRKLNLAFVPTVGAPVF
jgi:hypothetical protein